MAKKTMLVKGIDPITGLPVPLKPGEYTPGEGIEDPDGNRVYTEGGYPPPGGGAPPISGLKGATLVAAGSISGPALVIGEKTVPVLVDVNAPGTMRFYWVGISVDPAPGVATGFPTAYIAMGVFVTGQQWSELILETKALIVSTVVGTFNYKVYRIDET